MSDITVTLITEERKPVDLMSPIKTVEDLEKHVEELIFQELKINRKIPSDCEEKEDDIWIVYFRGYIRSYFMFVVYDSIVL